MIANNYFERPLLSVERNFSHHEEEAYGHRRVTKATIRKGAEEVY